MKKYILYITVMLIMSVASVVGQTSYSSLEINYLTNTTDDLPVDVFLGVDGGVAFIDGNFDPANPDDYNPSTGTLQREFDATLRDEFLVFVEKGIVSMDLGIGRRDLWMQLPDYVFEPDYELKSLEEIENYVKIHKHLPNIVGKKELEEKGYLDVDKMLMGQLQNLEELLLHTLQQEKTIETLEEENEQLIKMLNDLEERLEKLETKR